MEERMLSDEELLALIKKNSGGGGGGTSDYTQLSNLPQINSVELTGNKSLSDLGIASEESLSAVLDDLADEFDATATYAVGDYVLKDGVLYKCTTAHTGTWDANDFTATTISDEVADVADAVDDIKNGTDIDSFGDVETALAGKQDALTAGDYINLNNGNISVNRNLVGNNYDYEIKSTGDYKLTIIKSQGGTVISTNTYDYSYGTSTNIDNNFTIAGGYSGGNTWVYTALKDSTTHSAGYTWTKSVEAAFDETEAFPSEDLSGYKLVIKSEMDTALAGKVNTENGKGLSTNDYSDTEKAQVATNASDIGQLKSGLTNLDNEVNGDATVYPYADVITIEDAVPANLADCSVKIEPVQDLHGYSQPWVGGAGKNKCDKKDASSTNGIVNLTLNGTFGSVTEGQTYALSFDVLEGNSNEVQLRLNNTAGSITSWYSGGLVVGQRASISFTASASGTINFWSNTGAFSGNNKVFDNIQLELGSTATDYAPYENLCPISGHTEVDVQRNAVNQWDEQWELGIYNVDTGAKTSNDNYIRAKNPILVKENTVYYFQSNNVPARILFYDVNGDFISTLAGWKANASFTTPAGCGYVTFFMDNSYGTTYRNNIAINYPATNTEYAPYAGKTYTIALGDTRYGGGLDVNSGEYSDYGDIADEDDFTWIDGGTSAGGLHYVDYNVSAVSHVGMSNMLPKETSAWDKTYPCVNIYESRIRIYGNFTSLAEFKEQFSGLQVYYQKATPTTIQLTPQQIQLLKGHNTLTASTGDISVTVNGVSGSIGAVQEQVNGLAEDVAVLDNLISHGFVTIPTGFYCEDAYKAKYTAIGNGTHGIVQINGVVKTSQALTASTDYTICSVPFTSIREAFGLEFNESGTIAIDKDSGDVVYTPSASVAQYTPIKFSIAFCF